MDKHILNLPVDKEEIAKLKVGDVVYIRGIFYTARDMAHLRIRKQLAEGETPAMHFKGSAIFHAGPVATKADDNTWTLNVIGPTTSIRMEPYAEMVGELGVSAVIGKGGMAADTLEACAKYGYVYLQAAPGCAAKLAQGINKINSVTWLEMGMPEAVWELDAECFGPLVVAMDTHHNSIYDTLRKNARDIAAKTYPTQSYTVV